MRGARPPRERPRVPDAKRLLSSGRRVPAIIDARRDRPASPARLAPLRPAGRPPACRNGPELMRRAGLTNGDDAGNVDQRILREFVLCCKNGLGVPSGRATSAAGATRWDAADAAIIAAFNPKKP